MTKSYDIIVVGGGHAGTEAAYIGARMGCSVLLVTMKKDNLGEMSCNPAVGGVGKGQLVREIDAMGGIMGLAADYAGIHFKRLNLSKGPAVWSSRAQEDRKKYKTFIRSRLEEAEGLDIAEGLAEKILVENGVVRGILAGRDEISSGAVIVTPGTFLNGMMHIGMNHFAGGRVDEESSVSLSGSIEELGFRMYRFKTGTPARLDGSTIDFSRLEVQRGDRSPVPFSFMTDHLIEKQVPCYITYTNERTHGFIREGFGRSPLFTGKIKGTGVRYCPSVEDKLLKFPDMNRHHVFLEPEGLANDVYYPNGVSTSLPEDVQDRFLHSIAGLEEVKVIRYGYGIEHDVIDPTQLSATLETKKIKGLYFAGQINGTTGYEEAAAQGIVAGINAAASVKKMPPLVLGRDQAYTGVLIDDLITKGTEEPYRMFTSRVEYRLILREDNACLRLTGLAGEYGCIDRKMRERFEEYSQELEKARKIIENEKIEDPSCAAGNAGGKKKVTLKELMRNPLVKWKDIKDLCPRAGRISGKIADQLNIEVKYEGYIRRQEMDIARLKSMEDWRIEPEFDYGAIKSLSIEVVEKLNKIQPQTVGQASRISGVTPAAVSAVMVYLRGQGKREK
ncbi:MAG: tRNA uridine-5-carboxymethylaminomethyl(34) synthesis enzyme MnmG [Elusimicrobia bacterium]|nr:tRNA uridine-5-carboxymethylaminomethyl(34) synthesis enzyme MnmG [Elusimicrobiota bacterium]